MTGQHRKPSPEPPTFLVRPVDADRVREAISGVVADAINRAAETLNKIRVWCDAEAAEAEAAMCCAEADCVNRATAAARLASIEEVRSLLPPLPEAAEEVTSCTEPE